MSDKLNWQCRHEDCQRVREGITDFCSSHNHMFRAIAKDISKPVKQPKPLKRSPLKKVSPKRQEQNLEYSKLRAEYLKAHPGCEIKLQGCERVAVEIHHSGKRHNDDLTNVEFFLASCRSCHEIIETKLSAKQRRELGFLKTIPKETI